MQGKMDKTKKEKKKITQLKWPKYKKKPKRQKYGMNEKLGAFTSLLGACKGFIGDCFYNLSMYHFFSWKEEDWHSNDKSPALFSLISPTWIILGVLCNVVISKELSWSFVGCGKIFDFGILRIIRLEICFLMIITNEPINVMYMHTPQKILSFLKYL